MLQIRPITLRDANRYVRENHRHNLPTNGHKFSIACYDGDRLCGVAIAGQPVARKLDDGLTIEIRRVCTDGTRNACSILYGACSRCAKEMGYKRVVTYTLQSEPGTSLKASGFTMGGWQAASVGTCLPGLVRWRKSRYSARNASILTKRKSDGRKGLSEDRADRR